MKIIMATVLLVLGTSAFASDSNLVSDLSKSLSGCLTSKQKANLASVSICAGGINGDKAGAIVIVALKDGSIINYSYDMGINGYSIDRGINGCINKSYGINGKFDSCN